MSNVPGPQRDEEIHIGFDPSEQSTINGIHEHVEPLSLI